MKNQLTYLTGAPEQGGFAWPRNSDFLLNKTGCVLGLFSGWRPCVIKEKSILLFFRHFDVIYIVWMEIRCLRLNLKWLLFSCKYPV
jgi:hypothetical protein